MTIIIVFSYYKHFDGNTISSSTSKSVIFAPRKDKNKHKIVIYNDPVDDRIEELIRHERLKAMIQLTREVENGSGL